MATYCKHTAEFEGRVFEITCRYNVPMSIRVLQGEEMAGIGTECTVSLKAEAELRVADATDVFEEDLDGVTPAHLVPEQNRVVRAVEDILRKEGIFNDEGCCPCQFHLD